MLKSELRKIHLARQRALSPAERSAKSTRIADKFFAGFDLAGVRFLHCFIAIDKFNEIDTTVFFKRLWSEFPDVITVVPRVKMGTSEMESLKFTPQTELVKNIWDIHEPSHDEFIAAAQIDMVLVPGLAFDRSGHRVGYGKGFYDKFFSRCRPDCLKIGLSYFEPVEQITDIHEGDFPVDAVVSPNLIYRPRAEF